MVSTTSSLLALFASSLFAAVNYDEVIAAAGRLRDAGASPLLVTVIPWASAWATGLSFACAMFSITISLGLFCALCAANLSSHVKKSELLVSWVAAHYTLILCEVVSMQVSIVFLWIACVCVGIIKYAVQITLWSLTGLVTGLMLLGVLGYIARLHFVLTLPQLKLQGAEEDQEV